MVMAVWCLFLLLIALCRSFSPQYSGCMGPRAMRMAINDARRSPPSLLENLSFDVPEALDNLLRPVKYLTEDSTRTKARYVIPMLLRVGYFLSQGVGLSVVGIDKPVAQNEEETMTQLDPQAVIGALQDALLADDVGALAQPDDSFADQVAGSVRGTELQRSLFAKNFASIFQLLQREIENIEKGEYRLPYDLDPLQATENTLASRQWNPVHVASQLQTYVYDRRKVLDRRDRGDGLEVRRTFTSSKYPNYYLQNFHYQSDGWLSTRSARLYDYQVESLFLGTADAMRRQILPEVRKFMVGKHPADVKVLDVAAGTGRFVSFLLDNYRDLDCTVSDLSPYYLQEAKTTLKRFSQVKYAEAAAEELPFEDESFDALTCVYLFHELPREVRKAALHEFYRVLKPGGRLFFVDSAQKGEVPYDHVLKGFTIVAHEPYYMDYSEMDLAGPQGMMASVGFSNIKSGVHWVSKTVVATKPEAGPTPHINVIAPQEEGEEDD